MSLTHTRDERRERLFTGGVHVFQPAGVIAALRNEATYVANGKNGTCLVKNDSLRVVLEVIRAGSGLAEHRAPGPITVQILEGEVRFETEGEVVYLREGELLTLPGGRPHSVEAVMDTAFLITISS